MPNQTSAGNYNANWINELDKFRPEGTESKSFGDDAIREIKRAIANTFPNAETGVPLTADFSQLNDLAAGNTLPKDSVIMWSGNQGALPNGPDGWTICDGRSRPDGSTSPDLRGKFVWGAKTNGSNNSGSVQAGQTGGNNSTQVKKTNGDFVQFGTNSTTLTKDQIPEHDHSMFSNAASGDTQHPTTGRLAVQNLSGNNQSYYISRSSGGADTGATSKQGGSKGHNHTFKIDDGGTTRSNVPAYYSMLYIIKD